MSMICPLCGEENQDNAKICSICGACLCKEETEKQEEKEEWFIKCPKCGKEHIVLGAMSRILECEYCFDEFDREEIRNCIPQKRIISICDSENSTASYLVLEDRKRKASIKIRKEEIIGREGTILSEIFEQNLYVSRKQAKVFIRNNNWYIEHLSQTNKTAVNRSILSLEMPVRLRSGDMIRFADYFFKVNIENEFNEHVEEAGGNWIIDCPICGKRYYGDSPEFRVRECTGACSMDEIDKCEIASITPRWVDE